MPEINISDKKKRDAVVNANSVTIRSTVRWLDDKQAQAENRKILRATMERDLDAMLLEFGDLDAVAEALIDQDPEVDIERFGQFLSDTSRVYVDSDGQLVHKVLHQEVVLDPAGNEKERRPRKIAEANVNTETPLTWTGKKFKKSEIYSRFVFSGKVQITHINGLTYDFLYKMAEDLAESDSLMLLAGGPKGNEPLVFRRNSQSYRGFLEGRIDGDKYALILHLTHLELKAPEPVEEEKEEKTDG